MKNTNRYEIFVDGSFWGTGSIAEIDTLRKQGFTVKLAPQAGSVLLRAEASSRKAERKFVKAFTPNKYGEYA